MRITDNQTAALQAQLAGRFDEYKQMLNDMSKEEADVGYATLVAAAFFNAVRQRFIVDGKAAGDVEVIEFVRDARGRTTNATEIIVPDIAELLINLSIGKVSPEAKKDVDDNASFKIKALLLTMLIADENFSEAELAAFIAEARELAEESLQ